MTNETNEIQNEITSEKGLMELGVESNENNNNDNNTEITNSDKVLASRPEGLPEALWDYDSGTFKGNELFEAYQAEAKKALGLRKKLSEGLPKPPEKVEDYQIEIPDEISELVAANDATLDVVRQAAFSTGLSNDQLKSFVNLYLTGLAEKGLVNADQGLSDEQLAQNDAQYVEQEKAKLGANANQILKGLDTWGHQLKSDGVLSEEDRQALRSMAHSAAEVRVLDKIRSLISGEPQIPTVTAESSGVPSREELDAMVADPRYTTDPAYRNEVTKKFNMVYGN